MVGPLHVDESYLVFRSFSRHERGVMLDVGAHYGSSLAPFAGRGWDVHAFEPDPANREQLAARFGATPNVRIVAKAVADEPGELPLYTSPESTGISSLAPFHESHEPSGVVPVTTLAGYIAEAGVESVDFLKIDVEGYERNVMRGHDWRVKPRAVVAEFEDGKTVPLGYSAAELADELAGHGYRVLVSEWEPIVRYGAAHRWRRFVERSDWDPDPESWGNLIAVEEADWTRTMRAAAASERRLRTGDAIRRVLRRS